MDEWTFCLFVTPGAVSTSCYHKSFLICHPCPLHRAGLSGPPRGVLQLKRVAHGIKRSVGEAGSIRLPITDETLLLIFKALDFSKHAHIMFWAPCNLAHFGFLHSSEFTVPNLGSFSPDIHLSVADLAIDSYDVPTCLCIRLKASKTDPFRKGCLIHVGKGNPPLCAIHSLMAYLQLRGNGARPLFLLQDGRLLSRALRTDWLRRILTEAGVQGPFSSQSFHIGAATVAAHNGIPDHLIKNWVARQAMHIRYISAPHPSLLLSCHLNCSSLGWVDSCPAGSLIRRWLS